MSQPGDPLEIDSESSIEPPQQQQKQRPEALAATAIEEESGSLQPQQALLSRLLNGIWTVGSSVATAGQSVREYFFSPASPSADAHRTEIVRKLHERKAEYIRPISLNVSICTWNVNEGSPPPPAELARWLLPTLNDGPPEQNVPDILLVGLQEAEVGGTSLILELTDACITWLEAITDCLNDMGRGRYRYKKVSVVQLVGVVLICVARVEHLPHIFNVKACTQRLGAMSRVGNKGSVALRANIYSRRCLFICSHFVPHAGKHAERDANYHSTMRSLNIYTAPESEDALACALHECRGPSARSEHQTVRPSLRQRLFARNAPYLSHEQERESEMKTLNSYHYVFFFGDLNYRIHRFSGQEAVEAIAGGRRGELLAEDELRGSMRDGSAFIGFVEPALEFQPTYKMSKKTGQYDTSKRAPAWTDRVLYSAPRRSKASPSPSKGNTPLTPGGSAGSPRRFSLTSILSGSFTRIGSGPAPDHTDEAEEPPMTVVQYKSVPLIGSDHLPVSAHFRVPAQQIDAETAANILIQLKCMNASERDQEGRDYVFYQSSSALYADDGVSGAKQEE